MAISWQERRIQVLISGLDAWCVGAQCCLHFCLAARSCVCNAVDDVSSLITEFIRVVAGVREAFCCTCCLLFEAQTVYFLPVVGGTNWSNCYKQLVAQTDALAACCWWYKLVHLLPAVGDINGALAACRWWYKLLMEMQIGGLVLFCIFNKPVHFLIVIA